RSSSTVDAMESTPSAGADGLSGWTGSRRRPEGECAAAPKPTAGLRSIGGGGMDGSFACPECGSTVEVRGLAPGRQVRCGFCQRLLEVPYLPRVPVAPWKRRRFARPKWVPWAWSAIGVVAAVILIVLVVRIWRRHHQTALEESIYERIESSRLQQESGHLNLALIDLDVALELARKADPPLARLPLDELRTRRQDLARRD